MHILQDATPVEAQLRGIVGCILSHVGLSGMCMSPHGGIIGYALLHVEIIGYMYVVARGDYRVYVVARGDNRVCVCFRT